MIGNLIGLGSMLLGAASRLYPDSKDIASAAKATDAVRQSYNVLSTHSVTQSANRAYIAPMVVVEEPLLHQEYMGDLMQIVLLRDIVATLTHLSLQNTVSVGVKVENLVGSINPNRGGMMSFAGLEDMKDPNPEEDEATKKAKDKAAEKAKDEENRKVVHINGKSYVDLQEYTPLAVGKVVSATAYGENGTKVEYPLVFKEIPVPATLKDLKLVFSAAKIEDGFFARWLMTKTGEITTPEFLTGKDIVKERFRIRNQEMTGYYKEAMKRESGNRMAAIKTGVVSINTMANTFIIGHDTAIQLELEIGKRFSDEHSRNEIFKAVKANTIVICNEDRGVFTFYTHGAAMAERYTRRDIQTKAKKDNGNSTLNDLVTLLNGAR